MWENATRKSSDRASASGSALGGLDGGRDECASGEAERVRGSCCGSGALADRVVLEVMQAVSGTPPLAVNILIGILLTHWHLAGVLVMHSMGDV